MDTTQNNSNGRGRPLEDLTGKQFEALTVLGKAPRRAGHTYWECECVCGNRVTRQPCDLKSGRSRSCGCLRGRLSSQTKERRRLASIHGNMLGRCLSEFHASYALYGGRGITICDQWLDLETFIEWALNHGYHETLTIDRIDNDRGYSPDNCRWATMAEQSRNRRTTVLNASQAAAIKELLDLGAPPCVIARAGNMRNHLVYNIKNNGAWS